MCTSVYINITIYTSDTDKLTICLENRPIRKLIVFLKEAKQGQHSKKHGSARLLQQQEFLPTRFCV